jgi:hypothetical protein
MIITRRDFLKLAVSDQDKNDGEAVVRPYERSERHG